MALSTKRAVDTNALEFEVGSAGHFTTTQRVSIGIFCVNCGFQ
jgi:hypothetical protein